MPGEQATWADLHEWLRFSSFPWARPWRAVLQRPPSVGTLALEALCVTLPSWVSASTWGGHAWVFPGKNRDGGPELPQTDSAWTLSCPEPWEQVQPPPLSLPGDQPASQAPWRSAEPGAARPLDPCVVTIGDVLHSWVWGHTQLTRHPCFLSFF